MLGVVENTSSFTCPDSGDVYDVFGSGGGRTIADEYDVPLLAELPIVPEIRSGGDGDKPVTVLQGTDAADRFLELRDAVIYRIGVLTGAPRSNGRRRPR